ncbi:TOMM precursor leader peptide-binding protein [Streptomyces sp. NPDC059101]|uniref:TOMM precursor leader peptide-binding protein n=1 Tax=Streptomyces sp. NPDC059101 TaxID=3346728 RepID=UPI0036BF13C8
MDTPRPAPRPPSPLTLRRDVRLVARDAHLYVCASTGTLRVPVRLPGDDADHGTVALDAVPERVAEGLRARGLAHPGDGRLPHPLYGDGADRGRRPVAVAGDGPLATEVADLLTRAGMRTVPADGADQPGAAVLPLGLPEDQLRGWTDLVLDRGTPLVTYLSTPTRLLLATLAPPRTPCPVCLVRRIRANHTWQPVAGLPLDRLLGAAESEAWPTTAVAAGAVAHAVLTALAAPEAPTGPAELTELDHATWERTGHTLFHTPGCPACGTAAVPPERDETAAVDAGESWRLMRGAVDPLTGLVPELRVDAAAGPEGGTTYARTAGMITTTWFSPVAAEARGGAVKSDPVNARVCAVGETLERYAAGVYDPDRFVRATLAELGDTAIDPRDLPLGSAGEYAAQRRYAPFDPDVAIDWVAGTSLTTGRPRYVPACAVYLPYRFPPAHKPWFDPISTGLAAGGSYHHAVLGGLMESVERDATLVFWENRLTLPSLDLTGLPDGPARRIVDRITAEGATVTCKDLTTDLGVPAVAVRFAEGTAERPVVVHAARADLDPHTALLGALEEACLCRTGAGIWLEEGEVPPADAALSSLSEFCLYYCAPERQQHLAFWADGPRHPLPAPRPAGSLQDDVAEAVRRLAARGHEAIAVDLTPIDVAECGVSVVRTVVPGLCPLTLRSDFHRRGGPRVRHAPVAMGVRATALTEDQLNPWPLPFL